MTASRFTRRSRRWWLVALVALAPSAGLAGLPAGAEAAPAASADMVGCRAVGPSLRYSGPAGARRVALTFDDGPGRHTAAILDLLARERVPATFFVLGAQVRARPALARRALAEGHAIGNHTFSHADVSGGGVGEITRTQEAVVRATGYTPCLFRAPYGLLSPLLIGQAREQGLITAGWDVDPRDWARPGSGTIVSHVLAAVHPGAIVVLHDGGGGREQTRAAVAQIIPRLRERGYDFVTVPRLLGLVGVRAPGPDRARPRTCVACKAETRDG